MAKQYDYDIGIIGGGAAGLTTASGAARLGAKTLLIEKEKALGGDCLHFGCVPSKTLISSARAYHTIVNAGKHGLPEVHAPPVDFAGIRDRIKNVISTIQEHDSEERFCGLGAKVEFGNPEFVDEHAVSLNGNTVSAKKWLIATGSSPGAPPVPGLEAAAYITNREIFSLEKLPASMAIIGGGPIAVEMGQAFSRLGTEVTIIEQADQILGREDRDLADELQGLLAASPNMTFHLNAKILSAKDSGGKKEVVFENGNGEEKQVRAETLLVAAGRTPNIYGLSLDKAGVGFTGRGVPVDARMRTSQKHIFAAGDVTGSFLFTHAAGYEGAIVIANAIFRLPRKADYTFLPWCTYTDPELASIGMNEKSAEQADISYAVWREDFRDNDRSLAMGNKAGQIKIILDEKENLIGVQILGPNAGIKKEGAFYLFTLRLIPAIPFFGINLGMALTGMRLWTFYWVSQVGMLAGTAVYINAGNQLGQISKMGDILSPSLIISFVILGIFPLAVKKTVNSLRAKTGKGKIHPT